MSNTAVDRVIDESIYLPPPRLSSPATLAQALASRRSARAFGLEPLPLAVLSALLWSADGINRQDSGGRPAPSAKLPTHHAGAERGLPAGDSVIAFTDAVA